MDSPQLTIDVDVLFSVPVTSAFLHVRELDQCRADYMYFTATLQVFSYTCESDADVSTNRQTNFQDRHERSWRL